MGIIRKQSILSSIFIYIGFAIGAINILYIFPVYLKTEEFGLTRLLIDVSRRVRANQGRGVQFGPGLPSLDGKRGNGVRAGCG